MTAAARPPSATSSRTPGAGGRASGSTVRVRRDPGARRRPRGHRGLQALDRDPTVDVIVSPAAVAPSRTCCRSRTRGWSAPCSRCRTPVVSCDRPRAGHPAARPGRRRARLHPDRRRQARRAGRRRGGTSGCCRPASAAAGRSHGLVEREQAQLTGAPVPPGPGRPRAAGRPSAARGRRATATGPGDLRHRLDRAADDVAHRLARVRALSPLATLRARLRRPPDADGQALSSVATLEPGQTCTSGSRTGASAPPPPPWTGSTLVATPTRPRTTSEDDPDPRAQLRGSPRPADRGGAHARAGRHHAWPSPRAVGARRGAGQGLPAHARRRSSPPRRGPRRRESAGL